MESLRKRPINQEELAADVEKLSKQDKDWFYTLYYEYMGAPENNWWGSLYGKAVISR